MEKDTPLNLGEFVVEHRNDLARHAELLDGGRRAAQAQDIVNMINDHFDPETQAIYVKFPLAEPVDVYECNPQNGEWSLITGETALTPYRGFVGDELIFIGEKILVADTNRGVAIDSLKDMEIRSKDDSEVQEFSQQARVETVQRLGHEALQKGENPALSQGRWGQEITFPDISDQTS